MGGSSWLCACSIVAALSGFGWAVRAQETPAPEQPKGFFEQDTLTGAWGSIGSDLQDAGVALGATEISETLGVVQGGVSPGLVYEGRLELDLDLDLEKIFGWNDSVLHANAYQIHGRGLSGNYLAGNLLTVSNIEAMRATRLFDLWIQTGFFDNTLSLRFGQIAADDEFLTSQYAGIFVSATFGWPAIMALALPGGGPAYPLSAPGIRFKLAVSNAVSSQIAFFNGNPDRLGGQNPFIIWETAYIPGPEPKDSATIYKAGLWYHGQGFDDLAVDRSGLLLADPKSNGIPRLHQGNFGFYALTDQLLYREPGSEDRGLGAFLRLAAAPDDRNFIGLYADAGLSYKGPFAGRDDDMAALGIAFAGVSDRARRLDAAARTLPATQLPVPDHEISLELTYQIALAPWWGVQPDMQYVIHPTSEVIRPGAGIAIPRTRDALIVGLRSSIKF